MKRILFIVVGVIACVFVSTLKKPGSNVNISNVQGVSCLGGTYPAVMASRGGRVEQIVLSDSSKNFTFALTRAASGY